ncbi:hypothetical protein COCNU_14G010770 [Cocos nucifera]|uniref:Uncharacterized protein n=1 Tax=Cocos nucifera TaxID=13894 RepID=A0A8K0IVX6_COCNU|nr:hypothetical protein COCNU_14G010770 [Cocos nucifera]
MAAVAVASSWPDMLAGVILESKRVVAAHSRHFLALTVLFLLPLSCLLIAAPSLPPFSTSSSLSPHPLPPPRSLLRLHHHNHLFDPSLANVALVFTCAAAALLLVLSAATAVAGSVHQGFFLHGTHTLPPGAPPTKSVPMAVG